MALMKVVTAPDPVLAKRASEIEKVDDNIRKLMDDMLETMYEEDGDGIAANQVGELKRVIIVDLSEYEQRRGVQTGVTYPLFMANPVITKFGEEQVEAEEGCLSIPGIVVDVSRSDEIEVEYLDYHNKKQTLKANGWLARAVQHEMDHINGKLLIDYLTPLKKEVAIRKLKKLKKRAA